MRTDPHHCFRHSRRRSPEQPAGPRGPLLLQDFHLIEKLQHFNCERVPERVVPAKGSGAFGTFTVTHDISRLTMAKLFSDRSTP